MNKTHTTTISLPANNKAKAISLTFADGTVKFAKVSRLTKTISWKGKYFLRNEVIGFTHYEQVSGEELSNIEIV